MGTIKNRNSKHLTEAEAIKVISLQLIKVNGGGGRRGRKNTQKNYTEKVLMTHITMMVWSLT